MSTGDLEARIRVLEAERDAARAETAALDLRFRLFADNVPGLVGYWDAGMRCQFANLSYENWFGRPRDSLLGITLADLMGDGLFAVTEPLIRAALAGERQSFERALVKPCGDTGYVWVQYIPDIDAAGQVLGMYVLATDVTSLKIKELALEDANRELTRARADAEAAADAKAHFLATMSHEIRTPLTSIIGFSGLLRDSFPAAEEAGRFSRRIYASSQGLLALINDILDHQLELEPTACDVSALLADVIDLLDVQARARRVTVTCEGAGSLPGALWLDEVRLRQILHNLIGNAIKFTADGHVSVSVTLIGEGAAASLHIFVTDTGVGISDEGQKALFQKFSQVDRKAGQARAGTGLGLMICKQLVELMGGHIGVTSRPGEGSRFHFSVPACLASSEARAEQDPDHGAHNPREILIADDHAVQSRTGRQGAGSRRPLGHRRRQRRRSGPGQPGTGVRPHLHGRQHAGDGRAGGHARHPFVVARQLRYPDRGPQRRQRGGNRQVPRRRHERFPRQADQCRPAGRSGRAGAGTVGGHGGVSQAGSVVARKDVGRHGDVFAPRPPGRGRRIAAGSRFYAGRPA